MGQLFGKMFPNSDIAKKYGLGRTKTTAIIQLLGNEDDDWISKILMDNPHSLATVSSELHCTDWAGNDIPQGSEFMPDQAEPCTVCLCDRGYATGCRSVSCSPPACPDFKQVDGVCCKFVCSDGFGRNGTGGGGGSEDSTELEDDTFANLGLRLVATTVTCFLVLALLLFVVYRIRQKRNLLQMRRYEERRQQQLDDDDQNFYPPTFIGIRCPPYEDLPPPYSPRPRIEQEEHPPPYEAIEGDNSESNNNTSNLAFNPTPQNMPPADSQQVTEMDSNCNRTVLPENVPDGLNNCQNSNRDISSSEVIFHRNLVKFITDLSINNRQIERNVLKKSVNSSFNNAAHSLNNDFNEEMPQISHSGQARSHDLTRKQEKFSDSSNRTEGRRSDLNTNMLVSIGMQGMSSDDDIAGFVRENVAFTTFGNLPVSSNLKIHSLISGKSESGENCPEVVLEPSNYVINNHGRYSSLPTKIMPPYAQTLNVDSFSNRVPTSRHKKSKSCGEKNSFVTFIESAQENKDKSSNKFNLNTSPNKKSGYLSEDSHQYGSQGPCHSEHSTCSRQYSPNKNITHPNRLDSFTEFDNICFPVSPSNDVQLPSRILESVISNLSVLSVCSGTGEKRTSNSDKILHPVFWNRQSREPNSRSSPVPLEKSFPDLEYRYSNDKYCVHQDRQSDTTELIKLANLNPCSTISSPSNRSVKNHSFTGNENVCTVNSDTVIPKFDNVSKELNSVNLQNHLDSCVDLVTRNTHADYKKRQNDCARKGNNDQIYLKRFSTGSLLQQKHCCTEQSSKSPVSHHHGHAGGPRIDNHSSPKYQSHGKRDLAKGAKQSGPYKQYGFIDDPNILVNFWNRASIVGKNDRDKDENSFIKYTQNQPEYNRLQSDIPETDINTMLYSKQSNWVDPSPASCRNCVSVHGKQPYDVDNSPTSLGVHSQKTTGLAVHEITEMSQSPVNVALKHLGARKKGCISKHAQHRKSFPYSQSYGSVKVSIPLMTQSPGDQNMFLTDNVLKSRKVKRPADDSGVHLDSSHASSYL